MLGRPRKNRRIYLIVTHVLDTKDIGKSLPPRYENIFDGFNPTGDATRRRSYLIETKDIKYVFKTNVASFWD